MELPPYPKITRAPHFYPDPQFAFRPGGNYSRVVVILRNMGSEFELLSELTSIEIIAINLSIRERRRLREQFGGRRWRKLKGIGLVRFPNGKARLAELHWYEAHGVGRRKMKVKRVLD